MNAVPHEPQGLTPLWRERHDAATFAPLPGHRVLVVEDDPVQALLLTLMLERLGVRVVLVTDGEQAVEAVQRMAFQLVLMDYRMPVACGAEATRRIRHWEREHARPATPIVAVTASAMQHERDACLAAGMDDVIVKPFSAQALADALARYCAVRQHGAFVFGAVS
jgi:CheY-like chemotaxis protein